MGNRKTNSDEYPSDEELARLEEIGYQDGVKHYSKMINARTRNAARTRGWDRAAAEDFRPARAQEE